MNRIFSNILAIGAAIALTAAPVYAGGEMLSDGDLDKIAAAALDLDTYGITNDDNLIAQSGGGVQNNESSQGVLTAVNNTNASQSDVANQSNVFALFGGAGDSTVTQENMATFNSHTGGNADAGTISSGFENDDILLGGSGGGVQNNDVSQELLLAINNTNASQSLVANQNNILVVKDSNVDKMIVTQENTATFTGSSSANYDADVDMFGANIYNDDSLIAQSGGGVQNNDDSQWALMAVNNTNASQSRVANQNNIMVVKLGDVINSEITQKNTASFNGHLAHNYGAGLDLWDADIDGFLTEDILFGGSGGGVQNNDYAQEFLMALNNTNASQSRVANQINLLVVNGSLTATNSTIMQSNTASFSN